MKIVWRIQICMRAVTLNSEFGLYGILSLLVCHCHGGPFLSLSTSIHSLSFNSIDDDGAQAISVAMTSMTKLHALQ